MAGEIQSGNLLFVPEHRFARQFLHCRRGRFVLRRKERAFVKKADLPRHIVPRVGFQLRNDDRQHIEHLAAVHVEPVQRAAADQAFHGAFVEFPAARAFAKVVKRAELRLGAARQNCADKAPPEVFDGEQPEADGAVLRGKARHALVDMRRQDVDPQPLRFADIGCHLGRGIEHAGQRGGQQLARIMAFEPRRLERDKRIGGGVGFVERVVGKRRHLVKQRLRHALCNAVRFGAGKEVFALFFHHVPFFLCHRAPHQVGGAVGIARHFAADLHHLLLIDHTAVGHGQNILHLFARIGRLLRVVAVVDIGINRIGGAGPVERDHRDQILERFGFQPRQHAAHPGGFKLEHTVGFAG